MFKNWFLPPITNAPGTLQFVLYDVNQQRFVEIEVLCLEIICSLYHLLTEHIVSVSAVQLWCYNACDNFTKSSYSYSSF